jgi:hypothetical protein
MDTLPSVAKILKQSYMSERLVRDRGALRTFGPTMATQAIIACCSVHARAALQKASTPAKTKIKQKNNVISIYCSGSQYVYIVLLAEDERTRCTASKRCLPLNYCIILAANSRERRTRQSRFQKACSIAYRSV